MIIYYKDLIQYLKKEIDNPQKYIGRNMSKYDKIIDKHLRLMRWFNNENAKIFYENGNWHLEEKDGVIFTYD